MNRKKLALCWLSMAVVICGAAQNTADLGIFEGATDVGNAELKGTGRYDAARGQYTLTGGGGNMWDKKDQFQFVWKRVAGNGVVTAEIHFPEQSSTPHRKAVLMFRQGLQPGAPYLDAAIHGNGLTALQFRETEDDITRGVRFPVNAPAWVRLERQGQWFTLLTSGDGSKFQEAGAVQVKLKDPLYVGIGLCSHNPKMLETAVFTHVSIQPARNAAHRQ